MSESSDDMAGFAFPAAAPAKKRGRAPGIWWLVAMLASSSGCGSNYYGQALRGQWQILASRQPVREVLASPLTSPSLRTKLELALSLRGFAERELKLPAHGHYLTYADVHRDHLVWTVSAAPEFSLEAKTWWYPLVGRLKYRGYFAEADARNCAARLEKQGWDTYVGGVDAYSTLGWFRDPLLNTFIDYDEADLAGVLFHELAHQKLFARGDSDFDEAFATVVEEEGVRRWLKSTGRQEALDHFERSLQFEAEFHALLGRTQASLQELYQSVAGRRMSDTPRAPAELRRQKDAVFARLQVDYTRLRERWPEKQNHTWVGRHPNNAKVASEDTYYRLTPAFRRLLAQNRNDLEAFYAAARRLARNPKAARQRAMDSLL